MSVYGDGLSAFGNLQTVEIPSTGPQAANDATAKAPLGALYRYNGNLFRYVKFNNGSGDVAALTGGVVHWKTLTPSTGVFTVTSDYTDSLANINAVAGIIGAVVTDAYFTWIQVGGVVNAKSHASTVAGDMQIGASTDLIFGRIAADANIVSVPFAVALGATANGKASVLLCAGVLACL